MPKLFSTTPRMWVLVYVDGEWKRGLLLGVKGDMARVRLNGRTEIVPKKTVAIYE